jgi:hypothetical protein
MAQFLFPDLPTFPGIGERDRLEHHTFVGPTNATRTGLASNVNPTDILDGRFLLGGSGWSSPHRTPAFTSFPISVIFCHRGERETRPTRVSVSACPDRQSGPYDFVFRETAACCNKPYRPLRPWWDGEPSLEGGSLFRDLNRPQAKTSALPLLPPVYPPEGLLLGGTPLKLLYEPNFRLNLHVVLMRLFTLYWLLTTSAEGRSSDSD